MPRAMTRTGVSLVRIFVSVASVLCDPIRKLLVSVLNMIRVYRGNQHVYAPRKASSGHPQYLGQSDAT